MKGKQSFHDDFVNPAADPLAQNQTVEFNMAEVEAALGEQAITEQLSPDDMVKLTKFVHAIFEWIVQTDLTKKNAQAVVGRRFLALAWVVNPELFEASPSATKLSKQLGISSSCEFHKLTGSAARQFGIKNTAQKHAWNRKEK